jgi:antitoxin ParD1/3/4
LVPRSRIRRARRVSIIALSLGFSQYLTRTATLEYKKGSDGQTAIQTMNISLPDSLKQFVDRQVGTRHYSTVSEYVRELIRQDERRQAKAHLENLLLEGLNTESSPMTHEDWAAIRRKGLAQIRNSRGGR